MGQEKFYPNKQNLGKDCQFWNLEGRSVGCNFPMRELEGRTTCEGSIDDVCIYVKTGERLPTLSDEKIIEIHNAHPVKGDPFDLPPGKSGTF